MRIAGIESRLLRYYVEGPCYYTKTPKLKLFCILIDRVGIKHDSRFGWAQSNLVQPKFPTLDRETTGPGRHAWESSKGALQTQMSEQLLLTGHPMDFEKFIFFFKDISLFSPKLSFSHQKTYPSIPISHRMLFHRPPNPYFI